MTNLVLSVITFVQVVTNWGPVQKNGAYVDDTHWPNYDFQLYDCKKVGLVESQEVLRIALPDGREVTNVLKSTKLSTITLLGRPCQDIIWCETNVWDVRPNVQSIQ